jgi:hypothetical protein
MYILELMPQYISVSELGARADHYMKDEFIQRERRKYLPFPQARLRTAVHRQQLAGKYLLF